MNKELAHDFIKFVMENYGIQLTVKEGDKEPFEFYFPDLAAVLEKKNNETTDNCTKRSSNESW